MPESVTLVVFLLATEVSDPVAGALERAATEVIGPEAKVTLVATQEDLTNEDMLARAGAADGVVELSWGYEHRTAELHCYLSRQERWLDRTITFDPQDAELERGRLLGFALGSMLVDSTRAQSGPAPPQSPPLPVRSTSTPGIDRPLPVSAAERIGRSLELGGTVSHAVDGVGDDLGVALGLRLRLIQAFWFRVGAQARFGEIEEAQATSRAVVGSLGLVWHPIEPEHAWQPGFGLRLDAYSGWLGVSHFSSDDDQADSQGRFTAGLTLLPEVSLGVSEYACVYLALGAEVATGRTDLYVKGTEVGTIPPFRLLAEGGVRASF